MKNKYICIHGHFYQPPRENPWLNFVEIQDSAYPYHDWNQRINAECYARNGASRILDGEGRVVDIINNYSRINFNMGPTLLSWMKNQAPACYQNILQADKDSQTRFSGHGSAIAQAFNHTIMPLTNARDQETQVIWGIEDFKSRFGRFPEGMWCGETAINTQTLEVLAKHGIKFTILSPYQAKSTRKIGDKKWKDVTGAKVDSRKGYRCQLPSGNSICLFFYDGPASQGVAFEGLLENGEVFANRLTDLFSKNDAVQLANIATDGESYGHHQRHGEMSLSFCLDKLERNDDIHLTVYGEFLEKFPPEYEAEIIENSSWSCSHGVERWKSDCGCNTGGNPGWTQEWRKPLREAFDWVREKFIGLYEDEMKGFSNDPWVLRNKYIHIILDRSKENIEKFLKENFDNDLNDEDKIKILRLLEMQYHTMLMYTSCGWFFDEVTGIESMQDIFYAARAIQLAEIVVGEKYEEDFIHLLEKIPSNIKEMGTAAEAYRRYVKPMIVDIKRVGAHYAIASLFKEFPEEYDLFNFRAKTQFKVFYEAGKHKLLIGNTEFQSDITFEKVNISYAVLYLGEHHLYGGVREYLGKEALEDLREKISESFHKSDIYEIFNVMHQYFGTHYYSFWYLFRDEQRAIMEIVLNTTLKNTEGMIEKMYEDSYHLLQIFKEINFKAPDQLKFPVDLTINSRLTEILKSETIDIPALKRVLDASFQVNVELDVVLLSYLVDEKISNLMKALKQHPSDKQLLNRLYTLLELINSSELTPDYWEAQNELFEIKNGYFQEIKEKAGTGDPEAISLQQSYHDLFNILNLII